MLKSLPMKKIPLTRGQFATVDDEDFVRFGTLRWYASFCAASGNFYASRMAPREGGKQKRILLHRAVLNAPAGVDVDHVNHITLDCRRSNLRTCSTSENLMNRSGASRNSKSGQLGVSLDKSRNKWRAQINVNGKRKNLGRFCSKSEAVKSYEKHSLKYYGAFSAVASRCVPS